LGSGRSGRINPEKEKVGAYKKKKKGGEEEIPKLETTIP